MAAEPSTTTAVGSLLNGNYLLERVIAEGGMGIVYEAQHLRIPRRFAVKVLLKPSGLGPEGATALARFRREAEIASTLAHPHIVEVFDFQVSEGGSPYLVMELLEGEDLADRLRRIGRMPAAAALRVVDEIAQALDVAHAGGVVHRDLKPANIFLSKRQGRDDFVKVLDFGVSKLIDSATLTQEKAMVGTPLYMSPEQAVGTQELSAESDVFSLGAIAFELLTGRRAFAASSIPSILYQIVHGPTPTLIGRAPGIGPEVDEVFARVLAKNKRDRFARSSEFALALARALERPQRVTVATGDWAGDVAGEIEDEDRRAGGGGPLELAGAAQTEVDHSTRAEAAMPEAAASRVEAAPSASALFIPRRRGWLAGVAAAALVVLVGGAAILKWGGKPEPADVGQPAAPGGATTPGNAPVPAIPPAGPPPAGPPATATATRSPPRPADSAPATVTAKEVKPISLSAKKSDVQFTFHVVPRTAQITVDERRVPGQQLTLPWQSRPHRVRVVAPGYRPFSLNMPSTTSRTFELRMERLRAPARPAHPRPTHDAAPVQDL